MHVAFDITAKRGHVVEVGGHTEVEMVWSRSDIEAAGHGTDVRVVYARFDGSLQCGAICLRRAWFVRMQNDVA